MKILILGSNEDIHAAHLKQSLTEKGITVEYLDTRLFPTKLKISWQPINHTGYLTFPDGRQWDLTDINKIFWRTFSGVNVPQLTDSYQQTIAVNDATGLLRSFMRCTPEKWVNGWEAYEFHKEKPLQLSLANKIGVTIPATLVTNDAQEIINFSQSYLDVIFKPVYGGSHTQLLTKEHLEINRMNLALSISPVTIQEYIPGTNIRSYVIGEKVYSAEIRSSSLDFREDKRAKLIYLETPEDIKRQCLAITKAFGLKWTGIDWRFKPNGDFIFLEANFSPMFLHFERETGCPITENLIELLTS
ncbi:ATP-grasp domain-containing protein [Dapis sp. BLCC M172]|uniref:ATP-grasp domain-containing protein n=1 Tax=Dapis sp. BLCC M172 TaxID=2975281 RepID=UPI003CE724D6